MVSVTSTHKLETVVSSIQALTQWQQEYDKSDGKNKNQRAMNFIYKDENIKIRTKKKTAKQKCLLI